MENANVRVRVSACICSGSRILLVQHSKDGEDYWLLPGGGLEVGETLQAAVRREVREETGLEAEPGRLLVVCESIQPQGRHILNLVFAAPCMPGELRPGRDGRLSDVRWMERADLPQLRLYPAIADSIEQCWDEDFAGPVRFLGNVWVEMEES